MIMSRLSRRSGVFAPLAALVHRFRAGDKVSLTETAGTLANRGQRFRVEATMPARDGEFQYRIRGEAEGFDRVASETMLTAAAQSEADAVFAATPEGDRHGKGPATQQQGNPQAETGEGRGEAR